MRVPKGRLSSPCERPESIAGPAAPHDCRCERTFASTQVARKPKRPAFELAVAFLEEPAAGFDLPLDIQGTAFECRVWKALQAIPPGETVTYSQIAERLGRPKSARAVGTACGANPLAVVVPCHRVVRGDGSLAGYRWGLSRKEDLLRREQQ